MDQAALSQIANKLNAIFAGEDVSGVRARANERLVNLSDFELDVIRLLQDTMGSDERTPLNEIYRDGLTEALEREFENQTEANALVRALEQPDFLQDVMQSRVGTVQVVIGGEGRWRELSSCSMVLARYGHEGFATGTVVGAPGPTRMQYGRAISTVRYVADLMSDLVTDLYGD